MKTTFSWLLYAAAALLAAVACAKVEGEIPENTVSADGHSVHVTVGAGIAESKSTVTTDGDGKRTLKFTAGDKIYVLASRGKSTIVNGVAYYEKVLCGYLSIDGDPSVGGTSAKFSGDLYVFDYDADSGGYVEGSYAFGSTDPLVAFTPSARLVHNGTYGSTFTVDDAKYGGYFNPNVVAATPDALLSSSLEIVGNYSSVNKQFSFSSSTTYLQTVFNCTISGLTTGTAYNVELWLGSDENCNESIFTYSGTTTASDGSASFAIFAPAEDNNFKLVLKAPGQALSVPLGHKVVQLATVYNISGTASFEPLATPLTFEAKTAGATVTFTAKAGATLEYSKNGGAWTTYTSAITLSNIGDKVSFRGDNTAMASNAAGDNCSKFTFTNEVYAYGNMMSLLSKSAFTETTSVPDYAFTRLFSYSNDLNGGINTNLFTHPSKPLKLPATTVGESSYAYLFNNCSEWTIAPALPAMELGNNCYEGLFFGCSDLTTVPELPATTLKQFCYSNMFNGCTSITTAPVLSAPALEVACYIQMFSGCSSLNSITCLATDISAADALLSWLSGVAETGRFYKAISASWENGVDGVPSGWSVVHSTFAGFNSETTAHPILEISSDLGGTSIITRNDGVVDLQGHTIFVLYCQNNTPGTTLTIQNGTLSGGIDGNGGWADNYYGTVRLVNMTINDVFNDGHAFVIESGTYTSVRNTAKDGTTYPGTYTIYGGYFNAFCNDLSSGHHYGTYTLYGGHYKFNPTTLGFGTVTIPDGYHLVDDGSGTYRWHVEKD